MGWSSVKPTTTTKIRNSPTIFLDNWEATEDWSNDEHYGLTSALSGSHKPGQCSVLMTDVTSAIDALGDVSCAAAYDVTLGVFKYNNGTTWVNVGGPIASGTKMLFYADTAPTGWTLDTALNDKVAYITKGSVAGGQTGGQAHSTGSWTITGFGGTTDSHAVTSSQMPAHTHTYTGGVNTYTRGSIVTAFALLVGGSTGNVGSGSGHSHVIADTIHAGTWRPAAYNFIICTKD